jgi:DNA polymerase III delta prime subunit
VQDLGQLSDYDFEQVVADLLAAEWGVHVEYFPRGRDNGVDLRVLGPTSAPLNIPSQKELVVQCKHMPNASLAQLRGHLRKEASKKIVDDAHRYLLVTSARLTRANKQEISSIFSGRLPEADILGRDDVDALLRRHPDVVHANMKLWLASGTALQTFLNQVEYLRSNLLQSELEHLRPRFVRTSIVAQAQKLLNRYGVCILAGPPGVGKTTTAEILLLQYLSEGWRPIVAISDVRELEAQVLPGIKQILFFDDFLGVTALPSKLARGDDSALVRLLHLIENDSSKAFILTTRDYILRQAQQDYEKLTDEIFDVARLAIKIRSITSSEREHILYNQLFFSPLRSAAAAAQDGPRKYAEVTRHRNYNPRLIEAAIAAAVRDLGNRSYDSLSADDSGYSGRRYDSDLLSGVNASSSGTIPDVPALIRDALDHPERLWEHVLLNQLTQLQREILVARLSLGTTIVEMSDFLRVVSNLSSVSGERPTQLALDMALRILDGDLISIRQGDFSAENQIFINPLHPGVADSLVAMINKYPEYLDGITASACTFEQVLWLAESLGVNRNNSQHPSPRKMSLFVSLLDCAERNLASPAVAATRSLGITWKPRAFADFGRRLEVLANIYASAARRSTVNVAEKAVPQFLKSISEVPADELVRVSRVLQRPVFRDWGWRRTQINVTILRQLDDPDGIDGWSNLRDALDLIEVVPEYERELTRKFENFFEEVVANAEDIAEDARRGEDVDLPIDELNQLEDLANQWGAYSLSVSDLIEEFERIQEELDENSTKGKKPDRSINQPTLFEVDEIGHEDGSIFDHL